MGGRALGSIGRKGEGGINPGRNKKIVFPVGGPFSLCPGRQHQGHADGAGVRFHSERMSGNFSTGKKNKAGGCGLLPTGGEVCLVD